MAHYYKTVPSAPLIPAPLKLRPYGAIQICLLLLLLLLAKPKQVRFQQPTEFAELSVRP